MKDIEIKRYTKGIEMRMFWMGQDVAEMPRDKMLDVIRELSRELEDTRSLLRATVEIANAESAKSAAK